MKRFIIFLIAFMSAVMVSLCIVLGIGLTRGAGFPFASNRDGAGRNYSLVLEKEIPAEGIRSLRIDYGKTFNDVLIYEGTGEGIIVREYMNFTPEEGRTSTVEQKGAELLVKGAGRGLFSFFSMGFQDAYTEIYLPADLAGDLEDFTVKTVSGDILSQISLRQRGAFNVSTTSGDISFQEVGAGKIQASTTSGDIRLASASAEDMAVSTTSGDVRVDRASGDAALSTTSGVVSLGKLEGDLRVSTTSGDVSLGQVKGRIQLSTTSGYVILEEGLGDLEAESTSGDIRVDRLEGVFQMETTSGMISVFGGKGFGRAESVSGDICVFLEKLGGDMDISTTSGSVRMQIPETASFAFRFDSTSGECRTFFDEMLTFNKKGNHAEGQYGGGEDKIAVSTTSGDLSVQCGEER